MEHTNYCRQMTIQFLKLITAPAEYKQQTDLAERMQHCITLASASTKFLLPSNGYFIEDDQLRGLDEKEPLCLPFQNVALEYKTTDDETTLGERSSKRIVFASQLEDGVIFRSVAWIDNSQTWIPYGAFLIPNYVYLDRTTIVDGLPSLRISPVTSPNGHQPEYESLQDVSYEARVLIGLLNTLACSNVRIESRPAKKNSKKIKSALPFDTYHILTIDVGKQASSSQHGAPGAGRSPREHLRRGHIRRLLDDRRIWVNATVVAAGKAAGKIKKDYVVRQHA